MSGFEVQPRALDAFARTLAEHGLHATSMSFRYAIDCGNYTDQYITLTGADGAVFRDLSTSAKALHDQIRTVSLKIGDALDSAGYNLAVSSDAYRRTDLAVAQRHDAAYKPTGVVELDSDVMPEAPVSDPADRLTTPGTDGLVSDQVDRVLGAADWFSVGGAVIKILDLFGIDPAGWVSDKLLGDADGVAKIKNALAALAAFDAQQADNLAHGLATLRHSWNGHAAEAASAYFTTLANAIQARSEKLLEAKSQFEGFIALLDAFTGLISGIISDIIDLGVAIAAELASAGCLSAIPGVNVIIGIVGAVTATRLYRRITDLADAWSEFSGKFSNWNQALHVLVAALGDLNTTVPLPKGTYYNPTTGTKPEQPDIFDPPTREPTAFR